MRMSAATVHAYHGAETLEAFAGWADRGVYVVASSSNPGGADLQQLPAGELALFEQVASMAASVGQHGNVGIVVGATQPELAARLRRRHPDLPFLLPGVGGQGAEVAAAVAAAYNGDPASCLVSASRSVLYASDPRSAASSCAMRSTQPHTTDEAARDINRCRPDDLCRAHLPHGRHANTVMMRGSAGTPRRARSSGP